MTCQLLVTPGVVQRASVLATVPVRFTSKIALVAVRPPPLRTNGMVKFVLPGALLVVLLKRLQR